MSVADSTFSGDNFNDFLSHFGFIGKPVETILVNDFGLKTMEDLCDLIEDQDMFDQVEQRVNYVDWQSFINALKKSDMICRHPAYTIVLANVDDSWSVVTHEKNSNLAEIGTTEMNHSSGKQIISGVTTTEIIRGNIANTQDLLSELTHSEANVKGNEEIQALALQFEKLKSDVKMQIESHHRQNIEKKAMKKKVEKALERKKLISELDPKLREAASLDICFMLDTTGSMAPFLKAVVKDLVVLTNELNQFYPEVPTRFALVAYKDFDYPIKTSDFTINRKMFEGELNGQVPNGGQGYGNVLQALKAVGNLEWMAATRILMHVGDMPCRGVRFGGPVEHSIDIASCVLPVLRQKNIQYFFGRIQYHTDIMITTFNAIMNDTAEKCDFISTVNCSNSEKLVETISSSVVQSMTSTLSSSVSITGSETRPVISLDRTEPIWTTLATEAANKYVMRKFTSLEEVMDTSSCRVVETHAIELIDVQVCKLPFDHGSNRVAYRAQVLSIGATDAVFKFSMKQSKKHSQKEYFEDGPILNHAVSVFLANEFDKLISTNFDQCARPPRIIFLELNLLHIFSRATNSYCTEEKTLTGSWIKLNNNSGMVNTSLPFNHEVVQSFCHWTLHFTNGELIVVDCQGNFDPIKDEYILTDPAIHSRDSSRFGGTNLSTLGMKRFFDTHRCNQFCHKLALTRPIF